MKNLSRSFPETGIRLNRLSLNYRPKTLKSQGEFLWKNPALPDGPEGQK
jgi:hypothetical protein